jgi:hypothetical protein
MTVAKINLLATIVSPMITDTFNLIVFSRNIRNSCFKQNNTATQWFFHEYLV